MRCCTAIKMPKTIKKSSLGEKCKLSSGINFVYYLYISVKSILLHLLSSTPRLVLIVKSVEEIFKSVCKKKLHVNVSISLINRERRRMGWVQTCTRYCQMIRAENKEKRLWFCTDILVQKEEFHDCIFTDESTVRCERFLAKQFRRLDEPSIPKPKPKAPAFSTCVGRNI